jgi:mRNA interferase RelE/StbE
MHGDLGRADRDSPTRGQVTYQVRLRPAALRSLQSMPEKIAAACWEFIHGALAENPYRVGKPLLEPLAPQYSARRGEYRVLYLIEDEQVTVVITSIRHRADAYRTR